MTYTYTPISVDIETNKRITENLLKLNEGQKKKINKMRLISYMEYLLRKRIEADGINQVRADIDIISPRKKRVKNETSPTRYNNNSAPKI